MKPYRGLLYAFDYAKSISILFYAIYKYGFQASWTVLEKLLKYITKLGRNGAYFSVIPAASGVRCPFLELQD